MANQLTDALKNHQSTFGVELTDSQIESLNDYYRLVIADNDLLHLVAPCTPESFATRHILESLTLLEYLPKGARFADIGPGAGLPSIPCLLVRDDLSAVLIESSLKKSGFLARLVDTLGLDGRTRIINKQFEEVPAPHADVITSRALDKFTKKLPALLKWGKGAKYVFFGGNTMRDELKKLNIKYSERLLPMSEQRFIFVISR